MADDPQKPPPDSGRIPGSPRDQEASAAADGSVPATPPKAAADKPAGAAPAEPLKAEVSRTDAPGAGASAAPPATPAKEPAPKPANPAAASTATTSETSSATGAPSAPATPPAKPAPAAAAAAKPAAPAAKPAAPAAGAAAKPAAAAAKPAPPHVPAPPAPPSGPTEPPPPADAAVPAYIAALQRDLPGGVTHVSLYLGDWTMVVPAAQLLEVARRLRDGAEGLFDFCSDVTATDWPPRSGEGRFDVVYCYGLLYHLGNPERALARLAEVCDGMLLLDNGAFTLYGLGESTCSESYVDGFEAWANAILARCPQAVAVIPDEA